MNDDYRNVENHRPPRQVTEFTKDAKDKIAEIINVKSKENWLAPTVEGYVYGTTRALDIGDYHGTLGKLFKNNLSEWEHAVNRNADLFGWDELHEEDEQHQPRYLTFRKASMHVNHNSQDPQLAIGLVFDATVVATDYKDAHLVILFGIDRMKAANIARTLETYPTRVFTSMGCSIKSSVCTACGKEIYKDTDLCNCLKYHRGGRVHGKKVAELLKKMAFYEQSIVTTPACPSARVLDAVTEILPGRILKVASTEDITKDADIVLQIMANVNYAVKHAANLQEKKRLASQLEALIYKLEGMLEVA